MIKERLLGDLKNALKNGEAELVSAIRFLLAQIQNEEIKSRGQGGSEGLSEEATLAIIKSEAKRRSEAVEMFKKGGRDDLVAKEEKDIAIIKAYLPPELDRDEITAVVKKLHAGGLSDFNSLMKAVMAELKGKANGKEVAEIIREVLNG